MAVQAGTLAGCRAGAAPKVTTPKLTLIAMLDAQAILGLGSVATRTALYEHVLAQFEAEQPGLAVRVVPYTSTATTMTAIVAGEGPDVFGDGAGQYPNYMQKHLLLRLDGYFQRDNVDTSAWPAAATTALSTPSGTYAVNRGLDPFLFAVNLTLLDELGHAYPSPDWSHSEFAALAQALTSNSGAKTRYGVVFQGGPADLGTSNEVVMGFGGQFTNSSRTVQTLSAPASLQGLAWLVDDLLLPGAGVNGTANGTLSAGTAGIEEIQQVQLLSDFKHWQHQLKWALYPPPVYPVRRAGAMAVNFWGISATTPRAEAAWTLLRWMTTSAPFQQFLMKTFLVAPAQTALLSEWLATVEAVAPGLKGEGLHYFVDSMVNGWGYAQPWFAYDNTQAQAIDSGWWRRVLAGSVSVEAGMVGADQQVNALERSVAGSKPAPAGG